MTPLDCSTVIVSYNTLNLTRTAIETALSAAGTLAHEVIVVDNASSDGSAAHLAEAFADDSRVHVVARTNNAGFAVANNVGAALARGRVLYFLNSDTVSHGDAIVALVRFLDATPGAGAVGPHVLNPDGTDQASFARFDTAWTLLRHYFPIAGHSSGRARPARATPVEVVIGSALALTREAFDRTGGWDEHYFMYSEELELCWQLRAAGYTSYYVPDAQITHFGGQSSLDRYTEQQIMTAESGLAFLRRHAPAHVLWANRVGGALGFAARDVAFAALARLQPAKAADYRRRGDAARALWKWFAFSYRAPASHAQHASV